MSELLSIAEKVVGWAREGEQVEAYVSRGNDLEIKVHKGELESFSSAGTAGVGIRVVRGGKVGFAWAGSLDVEILQETLAEARDNGTFATADEFAGLAEPDGVVPVDIDLWRDDVAATPTADKVQLALDLERRVLARDSRIRGLDGLMYGDVQAEVAIATSTGIAGSTRATAAYAYAGTMAGDGDETQTGYGVTAGRGYADLDLERLEREAVESAIRMLGAVKPASAKLTVVLDPRIASTFFGIVASLCNGESVLKGRSLFAGRLGEVVAHPSLTLVNDPTDPMAFSASSTDDEGLATRRTSLIEGGELQSYLYDTRWARAAGATSTASANRSFKSTPSIGAAAVAPVPGTMTKDEIIAMVGEGLYVQDVSGIHSGVDPISGDFSVGAEGLMIRNGQLAEPVRECTIASTIQRMLTGIVAIGDDLEWGPGGAARITLAIGDVSLSGS